MRKASYLMAALACFAAMAPAQVIVELYTSEGCSSCPPADAVLQRLEASGGVIVLGEHVTYWDRLGWKDRFSAEAFTLRQEEYVRRFGIDSAYTPQMVVNGEAEFVGSDEGRARQEISKAAREAKAKIELSPDDGGVLVKVSGVPAAAKGADVILAVTETRLDTDVRGGENGGHKLRHTGVVRSMSTAGRIDGKAGDYSARARYRLDPSWKRENLKLVVFVQDRASKKIWGAAAISP
ncbi:MAG TPA: DUF1223 domain-containing protein [Bryobacteraceae bacterium]|nr:DUF1223 domain-containing protein [Bryobacteraceae bacterium]